MTSQEPVGVGPDNPVQPQPATSQTQANDHLNSSRKLQKSKIKLEAYFIRRLLDKLKTGNRRSIHLSAAPGRLSGRLDLFDLANIDPDLPNQFISTLLSKKTFRFPISFKGVGFDEQIKLADLSKRLNHIVNQERENYLEFGQRNFAFGYPLLIKHDKADITKIIKAPLLIWDLEIERSDYDKNSWTINRVEDSPIKVNELLAAHIAKDEGLELPKLSDEILEDGLVDQGELLKLCDLMLGNLGARLGHSHLPGVTRCLDTKEFDNQHNADGGKRDPWLHFGGVFGIYKSPKQSIIQATESLLEGALEQELEFYALRQSNTASVATNPSQEEIINTLEDDEIKLIQGPPGTGKSQSIAAIISNALANGRQCLLVCEKKEALNVVYNKLEAIGLQDFAIVIDDVNKDRREVVEKARRIQTNHLESGIRQFEETEFNFKSQDFSATKQDYNRKHRNTLDLILGNKSRKDIIAHYPKGRSGWDQI